MNTQLLRFSVLSAVLVSLLSAGNSFAASTHTSNIFQLSELPGLSTGSQALELAAKCGSGACGSKDDTTKKDGEHKCGSGKDAKHTCGSKKDGNHKCGAAKDAKHTCGSKKDGNHKCGAAKDAKHTCGSKKEADHKCGTGSCGSKTPQKN
jgi:uncharacterized low-complexity protein